MYFRAGARPPPRIRAPRTDPPPAWAREDSVFVDRRRSHRGVQSLIVSPVAGFALREQARRLTIRNCAVLEAPLGENRHLEPEHRANAPPHDLTLQRIQPLVRAPRQL